MASLSEDLRHLPKLVALSQEVAVLVLLLHDRMGHRHAAGRAAPGWDPARGRGQDAPGSHGRGQLSGGRVAGALRADGSFGPSRTRVGAEIGRAVGGLLQEVLQFLLALLHLVLFQLVQLKVEQALAPEAEDG